MASRRASSSPSERSRGPEATAGVITPRASSRAIWARRSHRAARSSSKTGMRSSSTSASDRGPGVRAPEDLRAEHAYEVHEHDVHHHRLGGRGADADRAAGRVVAVVTADEHDRRGHDHALDAAEDEVGWVLEHPEDQEVAAGGDLTDLLDDREVAGEEARADRGDIHERQHHPRAEQ